MDGRHECEIEQTEALKRDPLGTIELASSRTGSKIVRDTRAAAPGLRWLARRLMRREQAALVRATGIRGVPSIESWDYARLVREFLPGVAMHLGTFDSSAYFKDALRLLQQLHRRGIVHNDLAKEANWICMPASRAGLVDFQLAGVFARRGRLFRILAREDLRHLLKHKRHYAPERLTRRQIEILERPGALVRVWRSAFKPVYVFVTRRMLGWPDRPGAHERQRPQPDAPAPRAELRYDSRPAAGRNARR
jgi:RIO-like serine/threonine protein kinase